MRCEGLVFFRDPQTVVFEDEEYIIFVDFSLFSRLGRYFYFNVTEKIMYILIFTIDIESLITHEQHYIR